jgi:hypothetical protein
MVLNRLFNRVYGMWGRYDLIIIISKGCCDWVPWAARHPVIRALCQSTNPKIQCESAGITDNGIHVRPNFRELQRILTDPKLAEIKERGGRTCLFLDDLTDLCTNEREEVGGRTTLMKDWFCTFFNTAARSLNIDILHTTQDTVQPYVPKTVRPRYRSYVLFARSPTDSLKAVVSARPFGLQGLRHLEEVLNVVTDGFEWNHLIINGGPPGGRHRYFTSQGAYEFVLPRIQRAAWIRMEGVPLHPMNDASMLAFLQHDAEGRPQLVPNPVVEPANNDAGAGAGAGAAAAAVVPVAGLSNPQVDFFTTIVVYDPSDARFQACDHCPVCMDDWLTLTTAGTVLRITNVVPNSTSCHHIFCDPCFRRWTQQLQNQVSGFICIHLHRIPYTF